MRRRGGSTYNYNARVRFFLGTKQNSASPDEYLYEKKSKLIVQRQIALTVGELPAKSQADSDTVWRHARSEPSRAAGRKLTEPRLSQCTVVPSGPSTCVHLKDRANKATPDPHVRIGQSRLPPPMERGKPMEQGLESGP